MQTTILPVNFDFNNIENLKFLEEILIKPAEPKQRFAEREQE